MDFSSPILTPPPPTTTTTTTHTPSRKLTECTYSHPLCRVNTKLRGLSLALIVLFAGCRRSTRRRSWAALTSSSCCWSSDPARTSRTTKVSTVRSASLTAVKGLYYETFLLSGEKKEWCSGPQNNAARTAVGLQRGPSEDYDLRSTTGVPIWGETVLESRRRIGPCVKNTTGRTSSPVRSKQDLVIFCVLKEEEQETSSQDVEYPGTWL